MKTHKGDRMKPKRLIERAIAEAQNEVNDAKQRQKAIERLTESDFERPEDYQDEKQEKSHEVYVHSMYLMMLEKLAAEMKQQGIQ